MKNAIVKLVGNTLNTVSYISPKYASIKALDLFATPRKGKVTPQQIPFLETAKTTIINYNNLKITTYNWSGKKETILLAHGWESNSSRWEKLIKTLQKLDYNIVSLDAPAHGNSTGKQFNAILYSECIHLVSEHYKPEIIIGHSVGGMASAFFQYKYQVNHLNKLILLGAPSEFTGVFKRYMEMMSYNKRIENGLNKLILERFNQKPSYFSLAEFIKTIDTQTLVIHDTEDEVIPYSDAKSIADNGKNIKLITTTGFGHGLRKKPVNEHILNFITS